MMDSRGRDSGIDRMTGLTVPRQAPAGMGVSTCPQLAGVVLAGLRDSHERKLDPLDYEPVEREHGALPQNATPEQQVERYRLAQAAKLARLYDQGKLPPYLVRHMNKMRKQPKKMKLGFAAAWRRWLAKTGRDEETYRPRYGSPVELRRGRPATF